MRSEYCAVGGWLGRLFWFLLGLSLFFCLLLTRPAPALPDVQFEPDKCADPSTLGVHTPHPTTGTYDYGTLDCTGAPTNC